MVAFFIISSNLFPYDSVFVARTVIRTRSAGFIHKAVHFVLVKISRTGIALVFLVVFIIHTIITICLHKLLRFIHYIPHAEKCQPFAIDKEKKS